MCWRFQVQAFLENQTWKSILKKMFLVDVKRRYGTYWRYLQKYVAEIKDLRESHSSLVKRKTEECMAYILSKFQPVVKICIYYEHTQKEM